MTKLLVTTGGGFTEGAKYITEIVDIAEPEVVCEDYHPYPGDEDGITMPVGGLLANGEVMVCGGHGEDRCFYLGNKTVPVTMTTARAWSAAIVQDDGLSMWITGGDMTLDSTEVVAPEEADPAVLGPVLPYGLQQHCMVKLDELTYMILGGLTEGGALTSNTWLFHVSNQTFSPGPAMIRVKHDMSCGVIEAEDTKEKIVLVAGGYEYLGQGYLDEVETLSLSSPDGQFVRLNVTLPYQMTYSSPVMTYGMKSMILVGGFSLELDPYEMDTLIQISCKSSTDCKVETMPQKLRIPRYKPVAMLVPDSLVNCH